MSSTDTQQLERTVIKAAMKRLAEWKKKYPQGLIPFGSPGCVRPKVAWDLVHACLELDKARENAKANK